MKNDKAKKVTTREFMMKLIYQVDINKEGMESLEGMIESFLEDNLEYIQARYQELRLQYSNNPNIKLNSLTLEDIVDKEYMKKISSYLKDNNEEVDGLIDKYAKNWSVSRMPRVDISILRLSLCEMLCLEDIPKRVSVNEAVELAKIYCDDKAPKFINGILGSVIDEIGE